MNDRTINDTDQGSRPAKTPEPANAYGATMADSGAGMTAGSAAARDLYRVVHAIGEGGMGRMSLAQDERLNRWVAIKRLSAELADNTQLLERFRTEARSVAALTHFHIVHVYSMAEDEEGPYIAMEYVAGPDSARRADWPPELPNPPLDLEQYVKTQGVFDVARAIQIGCKLCSAVAYAHKHGVIHRDIKPVNIMINEDGEPKLADFGLARQGGHDREGLTQAGAQMFTLGYGAPEQETDASRVDGRADIYALGATLWFLLTGQNPRYFRESEAPEPLRAVLVRALQKDREKRFQTASEMEQSLDHTVSRTEGPSPTGSEIAPGQCIKCGHRHLLHPNEIFNRKFCESCGNPMLEPCLKCGAENGVWAKFCGPCGADLDSAFREAVKEIETEQECIDQLGRIKCTGSRFFGPWTDPDTGLQWHSDPSCGHTGRWYNPELQQWISEDPSGLGPDSNPFRFVRNRPTSAIDPSGLLTVIYMPGKVALGTVCDGPGVTDSGGRVIMSS